MTDESVQGQPDDAGVFATTSLALGQALAEIATMVGLNPDDGELYPITDRVRRIASEHKSWADAIAETAVRLRDAGYHGQLVDSVVRLIADRADDGKELAALRASAVVLPADWRKQLADGDYPEQVIDLIDSWRPATVEAAPTDAVALLWPDMATEGEAHTFGLAAVGCPDGATCYHSCAATCWRVRNCGPLSGVYRDGRWPTGVRIAHEAPDGAAGVSGTERGEVIGAKDVLTPAMQQHLVELLAAPHWHPETAGEWSTARALERRGYLRANVSQGHQPYSLTDKGREAAQALNSGVGTGTEASDV